MFLSDLSIKRPIFISMILIAIVLFGLIAFKNLGIDLYPKVEFPVITAITIVPGTDPETIETIVTDPIEEALSSIDSIKSLRSISAEGISQVIIEFDLDKEVDIAYQEVQAKIGSIRNDLPQDIHGPIIEKFDIDAAPVLILLASSQLPISEMTHLVDKEIAEQLKRIPQIGQIKMTGGREGKIWLWIDREKMEAYNLSVQDVQQAVQLWHLDVPGGRITQNQKEWLVKTKGELDQAEKFEELVIAQRGDYAVRFKDIGRVEAGLEEERSLARLDGKSALALMIGRQSGANTVEVAKNIKKEIQKLQTKLGPQGIQLEIAQDNSVFIEHSVGEVRFHLLFGGGLAVLIVLLFLRNLRSTFVCALALPTAVLGTFLLMSYFGFTQNMMTLLALSIAIGLLIDDAIVVQENIIRHMEEGESAPVASSAGCKEIALAVLATTLSVVAVFIPVAFIKGIVGRFFYQFGMTVSIAVLISMFVSFTLNPMFSSKWLKHPKKNRIYMSLERFFITLEKGYGWIVRVALQRRVLIVTIAFATFFGSLFLGKFLRFEFLPTEDQSEFSISVQAPQGSALTYTSNLLTEIEKRMEHYPWIEYQFSSIGSDAMRSVHIGSIYVKMLEKKERSISQQEAMRLTRQLLSDITGGTVTVEVVQRGGGGGGKMTDIQFEIRGPSLEKLSEISDKIVAQMKRSDGFVDISTSYETGKPQASIHINRAAASDVGLSPLAIGSTIKAAFGGLNIATFKQKGDRWDVALRFDEKFRQQVKEIGFLPVRSQKGELVPLNSVIDIAYEEGPTQIDRYNRIRQITVYANLNPEKMVLGEAMQAINGYFSQENLPLGYSFGFSGQAENFKESFGYMFFALLIAVVLVYMVLAAQFESLLHPFTIMLSLPLSLIGAIGALVLFKMTMNIFTMIGIIMLMGLVTKNGILLIDFIQTLTKEGKVSREKAIEIAATQRLRPILMTSLAVILGMLPVALGTGDGSESRGPMAVAVIGGLITSTLLTLIVIPVVYLLLEKWRERGVLFFMKGSLKWVMTKMLFNKSKYT